MVTADMVSSADRVVASLLLLAASMAAMNQSISRPNAASRINTASRCCCHTVIDGGATREGSWCKGNQRRNQSRLHRYAAFTKK